MTLRSKLGQNLILSAVLIVAAVFLSASVAHRPTPSPEPAAADRLTLTLDPAKSTLKYSVDSTLHTVHGTFALKGGSLQLDPATGAAAGEIIADATSGDSGDASRDNKMHKDVLESSRYTEIVFRPDHVDGTIPQQGPSNVQVHGTFALHGSEHQLAIPVTAEIQADQWKGTARFSIPYVQWGLKNPSKFLLKVNRTVQIDLELAGSVQRTQKIAMQR